MVPKEELPFYSRELVEIGDQVIKEDVLRFRLRLELDQFPKDYFAAEKLKDPERKEEYRFFVMGILDRMINDHLIIAYGESKGIKLSRKKMLERVEAKKREWNPKAFENFLTEKKIPYSRWRQMMEDEIKVQHIIDSEISEKIKVSLNEVQSYYNKNRRDFDRPERVRVRQIVTDTLEKAREVYRRLQKGENFAKIAVNHSLSPDRAKGGDLGYISRGSYPKEFDEYCFKLKKGEFSPIVKSDYGFHIFKVLDRKPAGRLTLMEATPKIQQILFEQKLKDQYEEWIKKARDEISITLNQDVLKSVI